MDNGIEIPPHLRCNDSNNNPKPTYTPSDFLSEHKFYRSYAFGDQDNNSRQSFPSCYVKLEVNSAFWSHIAHEEDCWIYTPNKGILKFGCFAPQEALQATLAEKGVTDSPLVFRLEHDPASPPKDKWENYSHSHVYLCDGEARVESEKAFKETLPLDFLLTYRRLVARGIQTRRNPDSPWQ